MESGQRISHRSAPDTGSLREDRKVPHSHKEHKRCGKGGEGLPTDPTPRSAQPLGLWGPKALMWGTPSEMPSKTPGLQQPRPFTQLTTGKTTGEAEVSQRGGLAEGEGTSRRGASGGSPGGRGRGKAGETVRGTAPRGTPRPPALSFVFPGSLHVRVPGRGEETRNTELEAREGHGDAEGAKVGSEAQGHPVMQHRADGVGAGEGCRVSASPLS